MNCKTSLTDHIKNMFCPMIEASNSIIYLSMLYTFTNFLASPCHCIYPPLQTFFVRFPTLGNFFYPPYKKKVSHYTQLLCTEKSSVQVNRSIFWHRKSISGYDKLLYADDKVHKMSVQQGLTDA